MLSNLLSDPTFFRPFIAFLGVTLAYFAGAFSAISKPDSPGRIVSVAVAILAILILGYLI